MVQDEVVGCSMAFIPFKPYLQIISFQSDFEEDPLTMMADDKSC